MYHVFNYAPCHEGVCGVEKQLHAIKISALDIGQFQQVLYDKLDVHGASCFIKELLNFGIEFMD
jgi:hypothetical protein